MPPPTRPRLIVAALLACLVLLAARAGAAGLCKDEQGTEQLPTNPALCAQLDPIVRKPRDLPLDQYESMLNQYLTGMCHRDFAVGWQRDKTVRDTGPFIAALANGQWTGTNFGTHNPVLIWYSPEMMTWLLANRPSDPTKTPATPAPIPDGAIMVKEMYSPPPASACRIPDLLKLRPNSQGMAVMVRDSAGARDGWFWGAIGWAGWTPDWPPPATNSPAFAGYGQYCTNCHASARDNQTFASLSNIKDQPGSPLTFLVEDFFQNQSDQVFSRVAHVSQHEKLREEAEHGPVTAPPQPARDVGLLAALHLPAATIRTPPTSINMPSQAYDHAWIPGDGPNPHSMFVTSDQCVGCHTAGGTGLQYEMTTPGPGSLLNNLSPYGTWRTSPMGLAGRDPIFFAQLASETQTFHPAASAKVQDTCLGCHGILGQRQFEIDKSPDGQCPPFQRDTLDAVPYPVGNPSAALATFGGLGRDGVSCATCHHMVLGETEIGKYQDAAQNRCVAERQKFLNPGNTGFARTFTGSFYVGAPEQIYGPFEQPKPKPMDHALGLTPAHSGTITSPEACGTCHTVHLPVMRDADEIGHTYEQTTYPEWAFSAYRTGVTPDGKLPSGAGALAESCQGCHMPKTDATNKPFMSKIASIQEYSNFPEVENGLPGADIDLSIREGFARHLLVGLNVFLIDMASQFSSVLGIATQDPMLGSMGVPPLDLTRQAMLDQAAHRTATINVTGSHMSATALTASVTVTNQTGHKLPSGVGFRRLWVDFRVLDGSGRTLWESGRANPNGLITDELGQPIAGELWWKPNCGGRIAGQPHQPHYEQITRQDQAQIYQELVTAPPTDTKAECGADAPPTGELTTSFLSICGKLKDNRLLPSGFLSLPQRVEISRALGAGEDMARDTSPVGVGTDPDYDAGGGDTLRYSIPLADMHGRPTAVEASLYYQAIPPFFLQDRFCTATGTDRARLTYIAADLKPKEPAAQGWKLFLVSSGQVAIGK
jgi:hypothetical protein